MENLNLEKISEGIIKYFESVGISKDNLLIISIIFFLVFEKCDDFILIFTLVLLLK